MKRRLYVLLLLGSFVPATALGQHQSVEERRLLPLTAEQQAAHALLDEEIRRVEAAYGRQKADLEARIRQQQIEHVDRKLFAEFEPCMSKLASADAAIDTIEAERRRLLEGQEGRFASLAELDKQRAAMYWGRDSIRAECDRFRKRLDAERPIRIAEEVRKVLPSELHELDREHERQLASLEQRRHRLRTAAGPVPEPSKPTPQISPQRATAQPPAEPSHRASSTHAQGSAPKPQTPDKSAPTTMPAKPTPNGKTSPVTPGSRINGEPERERPSPTPPEASSAILASDLKTPERTDKSNEEEPFFLVRAMNSVTAIFQRAQDAVVGLVTDTPGEKLKGCAAGKSRCPSSVYATLLRGMNRNAVLKALGPPKKQASESDVWGYVLPASDASQSGYGLLISFENDRVADISPVPLD